MTIPAAHHWVSIEPLHEWGYPYVEDRRELLRGSPRFEWVVVGSQSGRATDPDTDCLVRKRMRSIVWTCRAEGIPVFVKQVPIDGKCNRIPALWPPDLRVQQLPPGWTEILETYARGKNEVGK